MKNNYEQEYAIHAEINRRYDESNGDEKIAEACRAEHKALMDSIEAKGEVYAGGFRYFEDMKFRENKYIVIDECIFEDKAEGFINALKECGFTEFVYASTWSGSMEIAWLFTTFGCEIKGMVEVNGRFKGFPTEDWEKKHGLLISIN